MLSNNSEQTANESTYKCNNVVKIELKLSEKETLSINQDEKLSIFISKLFDSDRLQIGKPKYTISMNDENNRVLIEKQVGSIENLPRKEEPIHPFFVETEFARFLNTKSNTSLLDIESLDNVLIFSPHPDDDILGACALIHKLLKNNKRLSIVYMTSGKAAGSSDVRKEEAKRAIEVLGGTYENLEFINMPFYEHPERKVTEEDNIYLLNFFQKSKPDNIFICSDIFDPHLTHRKCFNVLILILKEKLLSNIQAYFYYSIWYVPKSNEFNQIIPYDFDIYKLKVNALLEHKSQFETKFMGNDPRPFYQRAISRDSNFGRRLNYDFCEIYYKLNKYI
jgi:LmbE family N-acetylglucosaminyl deacetylase